MTKSKQPKAETTVEKPAQTGELSDAALNPVSGAMVACMPTDQLASAHGTGGGGGAGKPTATNSPIIPVL